jgi:alanine-glyoxylate transaminase/serine-glyoxylate transaminase/serine-pyruvate transaminase
VFALAEALRLVDEEGMAARERRHREAAAALLEALAPLGFEPLVAPEQRLPMLTTLRLPAAVLSRGEAALRRELLRRHGIEVGGGLGKLAGAVWRIGLMGENARPASVARLLAALRDLL